MLALAEASPMESDPTPAGETELVQRAQGGDTAAFEDLYRRFAGRVYAISLRLAGDPGQAQETTQDVFVRAWQKLGNFEPGTSLGAWLRTITVNLHLDRVRASGRLAAREMQVEDLGSFAAPAPPGPVRALDLERAVAKLPEGARTVFVLHDVEGFEHQEIAQKLGLALGTCKAQLHRARRLLREALS